MAARISLSPLTIEQIAKGIAQHKGGHLDTNKG